LTDPLIVDTPFTVIVESDWAAVGVTVTVDELNGTVAVYAVTSDAKLGLRATPEPRTRLDRVASERGTEWLVDAAGPGPIVLVASAEKT